jgi:hypothetical protein
MFNGCRIFTAISVELPNTKSQLVVLTCRFIECVVRSLISRDDSHGNLREHGLGFTSE